MSQLIMGNRADQIAMISIAAPIIKNRKLYGNALTQDRCFLQSFAGIQKQELFKVAERVRLLHGRSIHSADGYRKTCYASQIGEEKLFFQFKHLFCAKETR
jgi:hypothetical protein